MATDDRPHRHAARAQATSPTGPTASPPANCRPPKPPRPQGIERNVVITQWDCSDPKHYLHDITATDKRKPTLNANGLIYGATENSTDLVPVLDPVSHKATELQDAGARSEDAVVEGRSDVAVALLGRRGDLGQPDQHAQPDVRREGPGVVHLARRPAGQSGLLQEGLGPSVGQGVPDRAARPRHLSMFDPKTGKITLVRTCFQTHHLVFAEDANNTLWIERGRARQRRARLAQHARCSTRPATRRSRRAGRRSSSTPTATASATNTSSRTSRSIRPRTSASSARFYGIGVNPHDGTIWGSVLGFPGLHRPRRSRARIRPRPRLPKSTSRRSPGYGPRGLDIDRNGVVWVPLVERPPGELRPPQVQGAAQRAEPRPGEHCPEGWTLYPFPGPQFET